MKENDTLTNWFPTILGVKQGDALSPTLFALYVNDLADEIKQLGGVGLSVERGTVAFRCMLTTLFCWQKQMLIYRTC